MLGYFKEIAGSRSFKIVVLLFVLVSLVQLTVMGIYIYQHRYPQSSLRNYRTVYQKNLPVLASIINLCDSASQYISKADQTIISLKKINIIVTKANHPTCVTRYSGKDLIKKLENADFYSYGYCFSRQIEEGKWENYQLVPNLKIDDIVGTLGIIKLILFLGFVIYLWFLVKLVIPLRQFEISALHLGMHLKSDSLNVKGFKILQNTTKALNFMQEKLLSILKVRTNILASLSHDLRAPITRMKLRSQMGKWDSVKMGHDLQDLETMIDSILLYAKEDVYTNEEFKRIDLNSLVEVIYYEYQDLGEVIQVTSNTKRRIEVLAKPIALKRALTNVINNSFKFGTQVTATSGVKEQKAVIQIKDNGPGVSQNQLDSLCKPFYQTNNSVSGSGLGLWITHEIIEHHNGKMKLFNHSKGGFCVEIILPIQIRSA